VASVEEAFAGMVVALEFVGASAALMVGTMAFGTGVEEEVPVKIVRQVQHFG